MRVAEVDACFADLATVAGAGSKARREQLLHDLFGRATAEEQSYLRGLVTGELRQGALDALVLEAVAAAAGVPVAAVRRAAMLAGATPPVAVAALTEGAAGLARFTLEVGRPVRPMLASSAPDLDAAFEGFAAGADGHPQPLAVDTKLDGIRVQVHRDGGTVRVFTRSLEEITDRVPEVVEAALALPAERFALDGEAIALDAAGRPRPFQETGARTASRTDVATLRRQVPLTPYFFDLLHLDGEDLLDQPARVRFDRLATLAPGPLVVPRTVTDDPASARELFTALVAAGHEGVVVKALDAPYEAGRRGAAWVKVKPRHTLDLVVLAVEWGSGRREGLLSNIHLGARDHDGGFVMLGKTFKGMTDEMLAWQTRRFLELETDRSSYVVRVRPEQVVEVAFDGLQRSSRYPGGLALRFARVLRYRDDKSAEEADTIETVRALAAP
ncbi:ATP-dependent DNA ligase [Nocardioides mesophilus]|uniref:ATP-dependent DNA ligase n=1 Tax=Nocardioides mesophilus TaxID=433659 RepID=UPI001FE9C812|nr:ATP-dependent DNA ligase [Nocardioides mesophilus]